MGYQPIGPDSRKQSSMGIYAGLAPSRNGSLSAEAIISHIQYMLKEFYPDAKRIKSKLDADDFPVWHTSLWRSMFRAEYDRLTLLRPAPPSAQYSVHGLLRSV